MKISKIQFEKEPSRRSVSSTQGFKLKGLECPGPNNFDAKTIPHYKIVYIKRKGEVLLNLATLIFSIESSFC
jgi:hypothetical protein